MSGDALSLSTDLLSLTDELSAKVQRLGSNLADVEATAVDLADLDRVRRHLELALQSLGSPRPLAPGAPSPEVTQAHRARALQDYSSDFADSLEKHFEASHGLTFDERGALGVHPSDSGWVQRQVLDFNKSIDVEIALDDTAPTEDEGSEGCPDFHGNTRAVSVPELIGFFQLQSKTGVLRIEAEHETFSLTYISGDLCRVYSSNSPTGQRLGELLIALGHLTAEQLEALLTKKSADVKLGELIRKEAQLSDVAISAALQLQVQGIFQRLCDVGAADFTFHAGAGSDTATQRRYNVTHLLLETARRKDEDLHEQRQGLDLLEG